jgi:hypothetical protein
VVADAPEGPVISMLGFDMHAVGRALDANGWVVG